MAFVAPGAVTMPRRTASVGTHRKSGIRKRLSRAKPTRAQERQILDSIIESRDDGLQLFSAEGASSEELAVYSYLPFPLLFIDYTEQKPRRMPRWDQLSEWMKLQVIILAMSEWRTFLTFTVHVGQAYQKRLVHGRRDVRKVIRDRIRRELDKITGGGSAYFFVVEGKSWRTKQPTTLHIHGGIWLIDRADEAKVRRAIERALGQGIGKYERQPRAYHSEWFYGGGAKFGDYILKFANCADERLLKKRLAVSREATATGRTLWEIITGRFENVNLKDLMREQGLGRDDEGNDCL